MISTLFNQKQYMQPSITRLMYIMKHHISRDIMTLYQAKKPVKKTGQKKDEVDEHLTALWYQEADDTCWKKAYGRGVGVHQSACPAGKVRVRDHCVSPCKDGYEPDGEICWELCPHEFLNDGAFCYKPASYKP